MLSVYLLLIFTLSKREVIPDSVTVKGATLVSMRWLELWHLLMSVSEKMIFKLKVH